MISPFIHQAACAALNHVLAQNSAACAGLRVHAGKHIALDLEVLRLRFAIRADGLLQRMGESSPFSVGAGLAPAQVNFHIRAADLPALLQDRSQATRYVRIAGDAHLAQDLAHYASLITWDAEADLARLIGDIAAVRMVSGARAGAQALKTNAQRSAENLSTYLVEKRAVLVRPPALETFSDAVVRLRDDVERLTKRIERLS